jgi:predicted DNA-binding transcriptional regulator AlpA
MNDLAGVTELAEMLGLTRTAIYSYIDRDDLGFPAPEVDLVRRRLWSRQAVAEWAAQTLPLPEGRPAQKEVWR